MTSISEKFAMNRPVKIYLLCVLAMVVALPACETGVNQTAGIDRGGIQGGAVGSVSGFGSVIVNGVHYETEGAVINVNGGPATEGDLRVGYVVVIQAITPAEGSGAQASTIDFSHDVIGPLSAVDVVNNRTTVLGQRVKINDATAYGPGIEPASVDGMALLVADQILRVSGFIGTDGEILATRIELGLAGSKLEVTGIVTNLNTAVRKFEIGGLVVDYSGAGVESFPGGMPAPGDRVVAEGAQFGLAGELVVAELKLKEPGTVFEEGARLEVEGLISLISSASSFRVSGISVMSNAATKYSGGDASMLGLDVRVEVEGRFDSSGVVVAEEVEFRPDGELGVEASAGSIELAAGTLQILGIPVQTTALTSSEDKSPAGLRPFSLADIRPGDPLRVVGNESLGVPGTIVATQIVRMEKLEELKLKGIAADVAEPTFSILGVTVFTDDQTVIGGDFFTQADGQLVRVIGDNAGGFFLAERAEIK
jgi:hypothetical protein